MSIAFDTLGYARRLQQGGISWEQAQAHSEAARDFIMVELVTKTDMKLAIDNAVLRLTVTIGLMFFTGSLAIIGGVAVIIDWLK